jgi:hypothetical protein
MTYRELAEYISNLADEQKDNDVTVFVSGVDEYYALVGDYPAVEADGDDVLDNGHPYLVI